MYEKYIRKAVKAVFSDAFTSDIQECKTDNREYDYFSSIDFINDDDIKKVYFGFKKQTLVEMINAYMFEEDPEDEIIEDFSGEMANLIVGKAKVFAQQDSKIVDIATPDILKSLPNGVELDIDYNYNNQCFSLCI
jgi:CheY-specific phosphatase CheX